MFHGSKTGKELLGASQKKIRMDQLDALDQTTAASQHIGSPPLFVAHGGARGIVAMLRSPTPLTSGQIPYPVFHPTYGEAMRDGYDMAPEKFSSNGFFQYTGDFRHSQRHGKGAVTMGDGSSIIGHFENGEICGRGVKTYYDGSTYTGDLNLGEPHGSGTYNGAADGEYYVGEFKFGQRSGKGVLHRTFQDEKYEGEFLGNVFHGKGTLEVRNLVSLTGEFQHGVPHGDCRASFLRMDHEFDGRFESGLEHGDQCVFLDRDCGITYRGAMAGGARKYVPNVLLPVEITVDSLPLESYFASGDAPTPLGSKCDRDREPLCHADSCIGVFPGQTIRIEVGLGLDEHLLHDSTSTTAAQQLSEALRRTSAGSSKKAAKSLASAPVTKGQAVHQLITCIAASRAQLRREESGRVISLRVGRTSSSLTTATGGSSKPVDAMGRTLQHGQTSASLAAAATTMQHRQQSTQLGLSTMINNNSFSGPAGALSMAATAIFSQPSLGRFAPQHEFDEVTFFDESATRAHIDRFIGEFFAGKHGDRSSVSSVATKKSNLRVLSSSTTPSIAVVTPGRMSRTPPQPNVALLGKQLQLLGRNDDDTTASTSRRPSARVEASPHNSLTAMSKKNAVDGKAAFLVTLPPGLLPGEYCIFVTAASEHCPRPGDEPECIPCVAPLVIPIRLSQLDFQKQKQYIKGLHGGRPDDDDEDDDIFAPMGESAQLIDFSIPIPGD